MYCSFYGLDERPFLVTPNPRYVFLSKHHREAFAHLLYGIDNHGGFIELTGEVGTGKTTVLRTLLGQLDEERYRLALIFNPCLSAIDLLGLINREFGLPWESRNGAELLDALYRFLLRENAAGRTVVLVIDEAQNLAPEVMEQVRLISNLETEQDKLIQIVLAGQPELGELLGRPELRQINQRITVRYHLRPMDFADTEAYIGHRLDVAGGRGGVAFAHGALKRLYREARGIPRLINVICDRVLLVGYAEGRHQITSSMMAKAIAEIAGERRQLRHRRLRVAAFGAGLAAVIAAAALFAARGRWGSVSAGSLAAPAALQPGAAAGLAGRLAAQRESDNAREALNSLLPAWGVKEITPLAGTDTVAAMEAAVRQRGLAFTRVAGNLGLLRRLDLPVLLELSLPGNVGRRFVAVTGVDGDRLRVRTQTLGETILSGADLDRVWAGRAYVVWRDPSRIALPLRPGARGPVVERLQLYLTRSGIYDGRVTGRLDPATLRAVRRFQASRGIPADGTIGELTLLFICRSGEGDRFPRLARGGEGKRP